MKNFLAIRAGTMENSGFVEMGLRFARLLDATNRQQPTAPPSGLPDRLKAMGGTNRRRITSKELAKLAGVSSATISRAFSPDSRIGSATRDRILAVAREYGYQPPHSITLTCTPRWGSTA